jgi:hypothetical protein
MWVLNAANATLRREKINRNSGSSPHLHFSAASV